MSFTLRGYQENAIDELRIGLRSGHKRQALMLATGSGKTAIAGTIAKAAVEKGNRVWFIVDSLELVDQAFETFEKIGLDVGVIQGQHEKTDYTKRVQVITAQTLTRRWNVFSTHIEWWPDLVFIDECHIQHKAHREAMEKLKKAPYIGLSATPFSKGLGIYYSNLINPVSVTDLIEQGYLSTFVAYGPDSPDMKGVKVQDGDYVASAAAERANTKKIVGNIVKTWLKLAGGRKATIVFACNIAHSENICKEFVAAGVDAVHLDGYTDKDERKEIVERYKRGEIKVLCSVQVLVKGFDAPITDCAILAAPTKSLAKYIQSVGRALRIHPGKTNALLLDHGGVISRLGWPDDPMPAWLDNGDKEEVAPKKEKEEKLPKPCPQCFYLHAEFICPQCGYKRPKQTHVEEVEGSLKKLEKVDMKEKIEFYAGLKGYAREKGFKDGWAYHKFKEKFGVYPTRTKVTPALKPTREVLNWITHLNIKHAKSKYKYKRATK